MDLLRLGVIIIAIVAALRRKFSPGTVLFGAGVLTAVLYRLSLPSLIQGYVDLILSGRFITLTLIVVTVTVLGALLKELGYLERLAAHCTRLPGGRRTAVALMPLLVGLMPMPGGSLLSAPLVASALEGTGRTAEFKCAVNYWFRHLAEFSWPIYPGLILTAGLTGMTVGDVSLLQLPLSVSMFAIGLLIFTRQIPRDGRRPASFPTTLLGILTTLWPILLAILLYGFLRINLALAVSLSLVLLILIQRPPFRSLIVAIRHGISPRLVFLVFGILSFQAVLEMTGTIKTIPAVAEQLHLPDVVVIVMVCFIIGFLTGMVSAYVGLGYSLLAGMLYQPTVIPAHILLAYISGFIGIMLAPSHVCLVLTNEYFGSELRAVYRQLALPLVLQALAGLVLVLMYS